MFKNITLASCLTVGLAVCHQVWGCKDGEEERCGSYCYGYRRCHTSSLKIRINSENPEKFVEQDFTDYFKSVSDMADALRGELIEDGAFGVISQKNSGESLEKAEDKARNIATFAFVFFDQDGSKIYSDCGSAFYFRPDANKENVHTPFFLFSGRKLRDYDKEKDSAAWDGLPNNVVKEEDLKTYNALKEIERLTKDSALVKRIGAHIDPVSLDFICKTGNNYQEYMTNLIINNVVKMPFFNRVHDRYKNLSAKPDQFCSTYNKVLMVETAEKKHKGKAYDFPKANTGRFVRSEQYGLYIRPLA